tara:strand:+ start:1485 stop:1709 length:225 start_codon:yes stop_codon:yes gene_type:complete
VYKMPGKNFPDLTGDGKVTQADVLKGRGVKGMMRGGKVNGMMRGGPVKMMRGGKVGYANGGCVRVKTNQNPHMS